MALWMEGRIGLSAARLETERVGCCFRREMMGEKVKQVDFSVYGRRRSPRRSLQRSLPRMSVATELPEEIAVSGKPLLYFCENNLVDSISEREFD